VLGRLFLRRKNPGFSPVAVVLGLDASGRLSKENDYLVVVFHILALP
jgi:hypothetical protein